MKKIFLFVLLAVTLTGCSSLTAPFRGTLSVDGDVDIGWEPVGSTAVISTTTATPATDPATPPPVSAQPAGPAPAAVGLKYQFDQGCAAAREAGLDERDFPACWLQRLQVGELGDWRDGFDARLSDVEVVVIAIQRLGQRFGAPSFEGMTLSIPNTQPALVWCPGGVEGDHPPDTARPLEGTAGAQWKDFLFVVDAGTGGPDRTVLAHQDQPCWMVYRR